APVPVLRGDGREHRSRRASLPRRHAHVGQRRRRLPAVQHPEGGPARARGGHAVAPATARAAGAGLHRRRHGGAATRLGALPRRAGHVRAGAEVSVVRRRTGGGAVWVAPGDPVWVDVVVPAGDRLWDDDVGRAVWWLGDAWAAALADLGLAAAGVHRGPMVRS